MRIVILAVLLIFSSLSCYNNSKGLTEQKIENKIKNNLPIGTSFDNVKSYLDNSKIEYSWQEKNSAFYGIIRNVNNRGLVSENIQLIIYMDKEKKLKSFEIKTIMTGP